MYGKFFAVIFLKGYYNINMKKFLLFIVSAAVFCAVFALSGCGRTKPERQTTPSLFETSTTERTTQTTKSSESATTPESTQTTEQTETTNTEETTDSSETTDTDTSDFFESSNGTLESTADPENTLPLPMRRK